MNIGSKPVHILSGFLGTGKTTLLNQLLERPDFSNTLVIINEFGEVPLDHHLIESNEETIVELSNGCLCCSIRGELVDTLLSVDTETFDRIIVETTGIADPLPIHQALTVQPILARGLRAGSIITVFDKVNGKSHLADHAEANQQLALADIVYLSMLDADGDMQAAETLVRGYNQSTALVTDPAEIRAEQIDGAISKELENNNSGHADEYVSIVLQTEKPQPVSAVIGFLNYLANRFGKSLLRIKGFANCTEHPAGPVLIQMSGPIVHDPVKLQAWPDGQPQTQLIVIGKGLDITMVKSLFDSFSDTAAVDTPDRAAMTENPLAIPGF
ncbi:MAG: GTP-binding protein [Pseudomonadota bacterium]